MQTLVTDEQEGDDMQEMPLPNVKALVLAKVVEFCQHHKDAPMDEIHKPLKCNVLGESGDEWATQFVDVAEQELLFELVLAANYMDMVLSQHGNAFYRLRCASIQFRCASPPGTHEHLIKKVTTFMRKLKTVKRIAKLKQNGCFYKPVSLREFRWSGCYRMLQRLEDFRPYLHLFQDDCEVDRDLSADDSADDLRRLPIVDFIPSMSEQRTIALLLDEMTAFDVITGKLQRQDMTVATVLDIFDIFGQASSWCGDSLAEKREEGLSSTSRRPQDRPASTATMPTTKTTKRKRAAEAVDVKITKRARKRGGLKSKYIDTKWVPSTSVAVERFFSTVKSTMDYLWKSMSHKYLEVIMFLKLNWDLVTLADVSKAIQESRSNTDAEQE
ncbi:hypothetical protein PC119_g20298 [Phytophthora cactorum]|nr:hypothetical protein PC119_g20298 [Phytophthora cactorum]